MHNTMYGSDLGSANTDRRPSNTIWRNCPWNNIQNHTIDGICDYDDFLDSPIAALGGTQTTQIQLGKYKVYNTGAAKNGLVAQMNSVEQYGGLYALPIDTAGDQAAFGYANGMYSFATTGSLALGEFWFECRIAIQSVATNDGQYFIGLGEVDALTFAAAVPLADADATANGGAMVGFNRLEDGLTALNTSYADRAATWTNIQATAGTVSAAFTFVKLGITFDRTNSSKCLKFFVNGLECTTGMTRAALAALTYLDAGALAPMAAVFGDSGAASCMYIDWWKSAQLMSPR